ncbi:aspartate--tRNA ligase [Scatolibacter rhodanostii]|uniref:aspartate--tRNA ligase n=1 Tax=Scatolibacter rhodanostii TaxID=2014781 RepID=UPI000C07AB87|nr:aspartate--tRNA ligase [Scatolibacter rhodanostii]
MLRTHVCNELRTKDIGQKATLSGWVDTIRDHGGIQFMDLRDHSGITQVVFHDDSMLEGVTKESVITVSGVVSARDEDTVNEKLDTGLVELVVDKIEILGECSNRLPFEIRDSQATREDVRLKYRYLDLRNPAIHENIVLRAKIISFLRKQMEELGFLEIQTPILAASSPEGARDYLVPSRKHKGKFYALPQAPQQFKQMLMVSGFDKYFQIAPCFRDEDARQDRSPGEFYQLDFEMAFAEQDDVLQVAEKVLYDTFSHFTEKKISAAPFKRIPYAESMLKYGTDKPDLRNPLEICDLTEFFSHVEFPLFKNKPVRGIVADCAGRSRTFFENSLKFATSIGMKGLGYLTLTDGTFKGPIEKFLSPEQKQELIDSLAMKDGDTLFFICDSIDVVNRYAGQIRTWLGENLDIIDTEAFEFCFIVDFPMYERDENTNQIIFTHNPFSMPQGGLEALETKNPLQILAYQYDVVCNGVELSSGAVRNHSPEIMKKAFAIAGYDEQELEKRFGALYTAFQYGAPPHAGMAPGVDRMVMLLAEEETIRDVIAFPLNGNAQDLLMGAPGEVSELQLREANIKIR